MEFSGNLMKMRTQLEAGAKNLAHYHLRLGETAVPMNDLVGSALTITFRDKINCIHCGKVTKKSYAQGFCYPCFKTAPEADPAIIKPELDQSHLGISRDMEWARENALTDHFVYLALASGVKVGVTRAANLPHRWIDQGAIRAIRLAKTPYRQLAGLIEVALKANFADKTNWRKMLTGDVEGDVDLAALKREAIALLPEELAGYRTDDDTLTTIDYPVLHYPSKVTSLGLDKNPVIEGTLTGIKGQYLYLDEGRVFNIRKHNGYLVNLKVSRP